MHWLNRILLAVLVAGVIAVAPRQFKAASDNDDLTRVVDEKAALIDTNAALQADIELLRAEVSALKGDRAEVARIAREDLNLVMPGGVVFEVDYEQPGGAR